MRVLISAVLVALVFAACSDDSTTTATPDSDAGADAPIDTGPVVVGSDEIKQSGQIVRALAPDEGVQASITIGTKTITTNADGTYEIAVPKDKPYQMTVSATDYYKLTEQEWSAKQDLPNGKTVMLPVSLANLLAGVLSPPRDATKGLLIVAVRPQPPCTSEEGTTLTIDPPGTAKVAYFDGNFPSPDQPSVKKGTSFSALFYDIEPGATVHVTATSPTCQQVPYPIELDGKTLTGNQKTEAGEALSYLRVFLGPLK